MIERLVKNRRLSIGIVLLVLLLISILASHLINQSNANPDLKEVKSKISRLMILPTDEQPSLATVEDRTLLNDNFLATHAQNGDRVLIYTNNHMVIIYRPSINKIAAVGTVQVDQALAEANSASLTILDGSNNPIKTQQIITKIRSSYPSIKITDGGKTSRQDFPDTIVIDNTNSKDNLTTALTSILPAKHGIVPLGVEKSNTDLMVLVGKD